MKRGGLALAVVLSFIALPFSVQASSSESALALEQRTGYLRALKEVSWRHTLWPRATTKPSLAEVLSPGVLEHEADDAVRQSAALAHYWGRPLTGAQLQAELERVAAHTRRPEVLGELFGALGNDPYLAAEVVARPLVANRLIRRWYSADERFHGKLRARASAELQQVGAVAGMRETSGKYVEVELRRADADAPEPGVVALDDTAWKDEIGRLARVFGSTVERLPVGVVSGLQEDRLRFYAAAVLERRPDRIKVAIVEWQKVPFETWWVAARNTVSAADVVPITATFKLPVVGAACTNDCWTGLSFTPLARAGEATVWTGSVMIVWGQVLFNPDSGGRYDPAIDTWHPISTVAAPSWRIQQTRIWTGTEMIVWGGWGGSYSDNSLNTGARYNPLTDTWIPTSVGPDVPTARTGHTAVWTGSEMIVWGGIHGFGDYEDTGSRYDPATDTWTAISRTGAPTARSGHGVVWSGSQMIVWGGSDVSGLVSTGGRYAPGTDSWTSTSTSNAPTPRSSFSTVGTGGGMIVWGGTTDGGFANVNTGGRYNPTSNTWVATATSGAPEGRRGHTAVWTGTEMIVWGGCVTHDCSDHRNTGGRYNPTRDSWTSTSTINAPSPRSFLSSVWTGTEMIVWGGCTGGECQIALDTGGRYSPSTDAWVPTGGAAVPYQRSLSAAVWTGAEMLVWGVDSEMLDKSVYRYHPATDSWSSVLSLNAPDARTGFSAVWTGIELIVWGGSVTGLGSSVTGGRFNPTTSSWTATSTAGAARARVWHSAVWTGSEMIVWGGCLDGSCTTVLNTGGRYHPASDTWAAIDALGAPTGRYLHSAEWTGSQMVVWAGVPVSNTGGRYDPATNRWAPTSTGGAPAARWGHATVWSGTEMIVWGGYDGATVFVTGGRYNPSTNSWTATSTTNAPFGRWDMSGVWTGSEMVVWGGIANPVWPFYTLDSGGRYDPATDTWSGTSQMFAPVARRAHRMVWTGSSVLIWGGWMEPATAPTPTGGLYAVSGIGGGPHAAPRLLSLAVDATTISAPTTGTVTLTGPAPSGGAAVTLATTDESLATVPPSVTIPHGATSQAFTIIPGIAPSLRAVNIWAYYGDSVDVLVQVYKSGPGLAALTVNPTSVTGGSSSTGTVTLTNPAPAGGAVITLTSSNPAAATVPASVTVPRGAASASFTVRTSGVTVGTAVGITATFAGSSLSATLNVQPSVALSSLRLSPQLLKGGGTSSGTVTLSTSAPPGGAVVTLASSHPAAAVPTSVTVPAGAVTTTFTVTTSPVATRTTVTITATYAPASKAARLVVTP